MDQKLPKLDVRMVSPLMTEEMLPKYGTAGAAGLDLRACIAKPLHLNQNETKLIGTGIAINLDDPGLAAVMVPRSGLGHKNGIVLGNLVGVIDSDYQGEIHISVWNRGNKNYTIQPFERLAQLLIVPVFQVEWNVVKDFVPTERAAGGFGSTGKA